MSINSCANYSYGLNINLQSLEKAILKIQEDIYLAAKAHAMNRVYKCQNIFLTQKEFVFAVIKKVILLLTKKCHLAKAYSRKLALVIYFALIKKRKTQFCILQFVKSKIVEYCILLLIKPEWEARCEKFLYIKQNTAYIQVISRFAAFFPKKADCRDFSSIKVKTWVNWKDLDGSCLIRKMVCGGYLFNKLNLWLKDYRYSFEKTNLNNLFNDLSLQSELYSLFSAVLYIGLEWHLYLNLKLELIFRYFHLFNQIGYLYCVSTNQVINNAIKYIGDFLHKININIRFFRCNIYRYINKFICLNDFNLVDKNGRFVVKPSQKSINQVFFTIRRKLYCKNHQGHQRINSYLRPSEALLFINRVLYQWQAYYWGALTQIDILLIQKTVDRMFYIWQVKK